MRTNAEPSMPALLEAYDRESNGDVKRGMLLAMAAIMGMSPLRDYTDRGFQQHAETVLDRARHRYPHLFPPDLVPLGTNALAPRTIHTRAGSDVHFLEWTRGGFLRHAQSKGD